MDSIVPIVVFIVCLFVIELIYYGFATVRGSDSKAVKRRLSGLKENSQGVPPVEILRRRQMSDIPWLNRLLQKVSVVQKLDAFLMQANVTMPVSLLILSSLVMLVLGYFTLSILTKDSFFPTAAGALIGCYLPFLFVRIKKDKRMKKFQRQLPDALELIARSMRAGLAFSSGLKMVSDEFDDPIGTEFQRVLEEINFGVSVPDALKNLAERVDCPDIKYFVVSVIIQRETGGNLTEIIDSIGSVIRERFKFEGKVKVLTAEAKFSAIILSVLPFLLATFIFFMNPKLIEVLIEDPVGRAMAGMALLLMAAGILVMRKMVQIKV